MPRKKKDSNTPKEPSKPGLFLVQFRASNGYQNTDLGQLFHKELAARKEGDRLVQAARSKDCDWCNLTIIPCIKGKDGRWDADPNTPVHQTRHTLKS